MAKIKFVVATRLSEKDFYEKSATGRSLNLYKYPFQEIRLFADNKIGLPKLYNIAIEESKNDPCVLIFCHDDLYILDYFWSDQLLMGLEEFQIVGVAGNKRRIPRQPSWAFPDINSSTLDSAEYLSGIVGHGSTFPPENISLYGPSCQQVKLLDGLFLATSSRTLEENNIRFDERFDFHFYDMDFCRQAESAGITCGTWPISLVHESPGNLASESWHKAYDRYLAKWGN